ncbi:ATP synthase protein I [Quillaja saponaria]|uniref:ATP synthase protein I n=1 Tax=Quillaja saponaria TaxID=32244 RepID=A0AAD7PA88_QUISA|nr:ATP synthase protein I [Quillaja saponaria]
MEALAKVRCLTASCNFQLPRISSLPRSRSAFSTRSSPSFSVLRDGPRTVNVADEDVLQIFFKERELSGDFISRASDLLWQKNLVNSVNSDVSRLADFSKQEDLVTESYDDDGFLKLTKTKEWVLGDNSAPINKKAIAKVLQDDSERRKKLNILQYESLKREMMFLSVGIGTACSVYCLIAFSIQAAVSYAIGVIFSCLYLQLLYQHADNLSRESVPQIFRQKKSKKIGIRSEDLKDSLERSIKGSGIALSSPRLVIPAAIYGLWILSHQYFANDFFNFQLVPAMLGVFVYKAAALVQVYRDNEDLRFVFPEDDVSRD